MRPIKTKALVGQKLKGTSGKRVIMLESVRKKKRWLDKRHKPWPSINRPLDKNLSVPVLCSDN